LIDLGLRGRDERCSPGRGRAGRQDLLGWDKHQERQHGQRHDSRQGSRNTNDPTI